MGAPRFIAKEIVTEVPLSFQTSASGQTVPLGSTYTHPRDFNIQLASFLNPFNLASPPTTVWIVGGHVLYVMCRYAAGGTGGGPPSGLWVEVHGQHASGAAFRLIENNMLDPTLATALTAGNGDAARYANGGACWALRVVFRNIGTVDITGLDYAICFRAY